VITEVVHPSLAVITNEMFLVMAVIRDVTCPVQAEMRNEMMAVTTDEMRLVMAVITDEMWLVIAVITDVTCPVQAETRNEMRLVMAVITDLSFLVLAVMTDHQSRKLEMRVSSVAVEGMGVEHLGPMTRTGHRLVEAEHQLLVRDTAQHSPVATQPEQAGQTRE